MDEESIDEAGTLPESVENDTIKYLDDIKKQKHEKKN